MSPKNNSYLRLVLAVIPAILLCGGVMWTMIEVHASAPHAGAVHRNEIELLRDVMSSEHRSLQQQIQDLKALVREK